jgi:HD-GYP domain-containing protein (c-di-GMP phosphodiesterase class II)
LSVALDLGEGHAPGHAQRSSLIGLRIATDLGIAPEDRESLLHTLLLKDAGCSGNASVIARVLGIDDHHAKRLMRGQARGEWPVAKMSEWHPIVSRLRRLSRSTGPKLAREFSRLRSEAGAQVAIAATGDPQAAAGIASLDERWDGSGFPDGRRAEEIPVNARIASLAQTIDVVHAALGLDGVLDFVQARRGVWFDPSMADVCATWGHDRLWWHDLAYEPQALPESEHDRILDEDDLDRVADAFALVIDGKNPYAPGHSQGVARVAEGIGSYLGYEGAGLRGLHRAALLHDLGNLGLSSRILDKAAPLSDEERDAMMEHPRFTWSILRRVDAFEDIGWAAALHHERLDGSGYPWGLAENEQDIDARIIAIADAYQAVTEIRAYREGISPDGAIRIIGKDSPHRYDARVFRALETWIADPSSRP